LNQTAREEVEDEHGKPGLSTEQFPRR